MAGGDKRSRGRVRTHDRDTNDGDEILGASLNIGVEHSTEVRNTNQKGLKEKCKRDYRNRLFHRLSLSVIIMGKRWHIILHG